MKYDPNVYGYVNGKPTYSRDEFIFTVRGFGPIENDADLLAFAEKVTSRWYNAGWHQTFATYYLSDYALSEPGRSLTVKEFNRLKELQQAAREAEKAADDAREWKLHQTIYWADNSVEEIWIDKNGAMPKASTPCCRSPAVRNPAATVCLSRARRAPARPTSPLPSPTT